MSSSIKNDGHETKLSPFQQVCDIRKTSSTIWRQVWGVEVFVAHSFRRQVTGYCWEWGLSGLLDFINCPSFQTYKLLAVMPANCPFQSLLGLYIKVHTRSKQNLSGSQTEQQPLLWIKQFLRQQTALRESTFSDWNLFRRSTGVWKFVAYLTKYIVHSCPPTSLRLAWHMNKASWYVKVVCRLKVRSWLENIPSVSQTNSTQVNDKLKIRSCLSRVWLNKDV